MCVQDFNLAQSMRQTVYEITSSGSGEALRLEQDKSRVGFIVLGPSTGTIEVTNYGGGSSASSGTISQTDTINQRRYSLTNIGKVIQNQQTFSTSAASSFKVVVYQLPLDAETRQEFAEGKNNK